MPKIDDPIEQARKQYLGDGEPFSSSLTRELFQKSFPILGGVFSFLRSAEQRQIQKEFNNHVLDILKVQEGDIEKYVANISDEASRVAAAAVERILWGATSQKAKRF